MTFGDYAQSSGIDSTALVILERMSEVITDIQSCRLKVETEYDIPVPDLGLIKHSDHADIIMKGPDKLLLSMSGDKGERAYFFNGQTLTYYSFGNNRYAQMSIPGTILNLADTIYSTFGIDFYIVDFFFPDFIDDLTLNSSSLVYLGLTPVDGQLCYHIAGVMTDFTYQIWLRKDPFCLPVKVVFVYHDQEYSPQFEARYRDWEINQLFPDALFEFSIPPHAIKSSFKPVDQ